MPKKINLESSPDFIWRDGEQFLVGEDFGKKFTRDILNWYDRDARELPWRQKPSLYKTVVSEFMLQQTQVVTVLPYFDRWIKIFPDFDTLASAEEKDVLKNWEGLGYYSRARNLHQLSKKIVKLGNIPDNNDDWLAFKGIGPYTAAAITSITFQQPVAVVDGNVIRILTRLAGIAEEFRDTGKATKKLTPLAQQLISRNRPRDYNQAIMELGAVICSRSTPLCTVCPVVNQCLAGRRGDPHKYPFLTPKKWNQLTVNRIWMEKENKLLLHLSPKGSHRLSEIYELPNATTLNPKLYKKHKLLRQSRSISNQRIMETIYRVNKTKDLERKITNTSTLIWIPKRQLPGITISGPHRKWIQILLN